MSPSSRRRDPSPGPNRRPKPQPASVPQSKPAESDLAPVDDDDLDDEVAEEIGARGAGARTTATTATSYGRLGPAAGIAYAILGFIGSSLLPVGDIEPSDPAADIAAQLVDQRGKISGGILLTLFSLFFLLVFVTWLHSWLRDVAARRERWLATLSLAGGILMVAMLSVVCLLAIASTVLEDYGPDPVIARTLFVAQWQAIAIAFMPTAAFVGATAVLAYTSRVLPRWLAYSGMAIGVGLLVPPLAFLPYLLSSLWTGMLAVVLLQRTRYG